MSRRKKPTPPKLTPEQFHAQFRNFVAGAQNKDLHKLKKQLKKHFTVISNELHRRFVDRKTEEADALARAEGACKAMANFMAGVTWALAARESLRKSKGHTPAGGVRPQSGQMWTLREIITAVRSQVKERGWHPITAESWEVVRNSLQAEARGVREPDSMSAVQFGVRMAAPVYAAVAISDRVIQQGYWVPDGD